MKNVFYKTKNVYHKTKNGLYKTQNVSIKQKMFDIKQITFIISFKFVSSGGGPRARNHGITNVSYCCVI